MLDPLFPFLDSFLEPLLEPTEEDVSHFIAQIDAFLESPDIKARRLPTTTPQPLTEEVFKEMWMLRYQHYMGQITFLELLNKYGEILGIPPLAESEE